jgi:hypothetical protein
MRKADRAVKALDRDPTEDQKKLIAREKEKYTSAKARFDELQEKYKAKFGAEYKPQDE